MVLELAKIGKLFRTEEIETAALSEISLVVKAGELLAIMGPSGCGKSTLLNILGLLDRPTSGVYRFFGSDVTKESEEKLTLLRRAHLGFVFQSFNLIDDLTAAENVEVPLIYRKISIAERRIRVATALEQVGIAHRKDHFPHQLSGGQQQRVAIARALVSRPSLILADEPTGNLDSSNGTGVLDLLSAMAKAGTAIVMVTHSPSDAAIADRTIEMLDGRAISESKTGA